MLWCTAMSNQLPVWSLYQRKSSHNRNDLLTPGIFDNVVHVKKRNSIRRRLIQIRVGDREFAPATCIENCHEERGRIWDANLFPFRLWFLLSDCSDIACPNRKAEASPRSPSKFYIHYISRPRMDWEDKLIRTKHIFTVLLRSDSDWLCVSFSNMDLITAKRFSWADPVFKAISSIGFIYMICAKPTMITAVLLVPVAAIPSSKVKRCAKVSELVDATFTTRPRAYCCKVQWFLPIDIEFKLSQE